LRARDRLADFAFFSFEWYPFDNLCEPPQPQLLRAPQIFERVLQQWRSEGVPRTIPWLATEYGYSSYAGQPEVDLHGAILNTEFVAQFLADGGGAAYFYGLEPDVLLRELHCPTYGNLLLFLSDAEHHIRYRLATYHAARLLTTVWLQPGGAHTMLAVDGASPTLSAFAVRRPDGRVALLVLNKDAKAATVRVRLGAADARALDVHQFSSHDYVWHADEERGHPDPDREPRMFRAAREVALPPLSITVVLLPGSAAP
jgi:hypothetical protein